jgi:hypothetical protein
MKSSRKLESGTSVQLAQQVRPCQREPSQGPIPASLEAIADVVLAYRPKPKTKAAKRRKRRDQYAKRRRSESSI